MQQRAIEAEGRSGRPSAEVRMWKSMAAVPACDVAQRSAEGVTRWSFGDEEEQVGCGHRIGRVVRKAVAKAAVSLRGPWEEDEGGTRKVVGRWRWL